MIYTFTESTDSNFLWNLASYRVDKNFNLTSIYACRLRFERAMFREYTVYAIRLVYIYAKKGKKKNCMSDIYFQFSKRTQR